MDANLKLHKPLVWKKLAQQISL